MKILFISLGCDKNLVDSEEMMGMLQQAGHTMTDTEEAADVIIINTCSFIHDAKEESIQTILDMAHYRAEGSVKALIVTGCLAQRYREEIRREIPEVDAVLGTASYDEILQAVEQAVAGCPYESFQELSRLPAAGPGRVITTGGAYEYLKIAEGCAKHCTYCVIPKIRGTYRSVPLEQLLEQARYLASAGVKELIIIAQETTLYGIDLYGEKTLHRLLSDLCRISGLQWIRLMYCYPEELYPELIQTIKEEPKICHYLDIPIQHCSDAVLKRMGRRTDRADLERIITGLRLEIPDIMLRTTLITGFPGETESEHRELMEFVADMAFDRLGVFSYSQEEGTPAAVMADQIPEEVKELRRQELMELQQEVSLQLGEEHIGKELLVFIEGKVADEEVYVGRSYGDAPGVDGYVFVHTRQALMTGDFVNVRITGALEYDLTGEIMDEYTE